ncbi:MAG: metallophosphoesterase [Candidatus Marinimicrobia bacterium]|nr:metallophosphoesterase [Candidatus Neomarinimicrobiota bacterium]
MKKQITIIILLFTLGLLSANVSIHDIQYTTDAGNGTYPSNYNGSAVTTGGIVSGINFKSNDTFFIQSSSGGAWSGIYIYDQDYSVAIGDSVIITGTVYEYHGLTEIKNITNFQKISSDNPLSMLTEISTNNVNSEEKYESVLVKVNDLNVTEKPSTDNSWKIDDGSGECPVYNNFFKVVENGYAVPSNNSLESVVGIVHSYDHNFYINPRNENDIDSLIENTVEYTDIGIGDTITVIQKPLMNIPFIGMVGDTIEILCMVEGEVNLEWSAKIQFDDFDYSLPIFDVIHEGDFYRLFATIPQVDFYELFDLVVSTGVETDTTENSVKLISNWKSDYYFVHITDSHLINHYFSSGSNSDPKFATDTSEMVDLREVINDINLINPEFVIFTGDIVNEGELEDYLNMRYYTKSQRIISELEVPVFITAGNHDLGGWEDTPPIQGTARRDWWKFYGWKWLENGTNFYPYHTQNYHFQYGSQHFIGLEAYDNYDSFMHTVYGDESFTNDQLNYLNSVLSTIPQNEKKVLFYHYDFSNQIDLTELGVDMTLWGHKHRNSGNINEHPYNLQTSATCDEKRAYRIIKVSENNLYPKTTVYSGDTGEKIGITYSTENDGTADSVTATIVNQHSISFENSLVKFKMPKSEHYQISNGTLKQIVGYDNFNLCYVETNLSANSIIEISIKLTNTAVKKSFQNKNFNLNINYPNPFNSSTTIEYYLPQNEFVILNIYNTAGKLVKNLVEKKQIAGLHSIQFNGNNLSSGVYICRMTAGNFTDSKKYVLVK